MEERNQNLVVHKFGGASLAPPEHVRRAAERLLKRRQAGMAVIAVASAMHGETNRLLALTESFAPRRHRRECDVVAAAGEQVSVGLVAMAIQSFGGKARSFLAPQAGIITDDNFGEAHIRTIAAQTILESIGRGEIPVIAGFQGVTPDGQLTTLGRGGSDTTAVAVAAALGAARCEIFKDVEGVYTTDPHLCRTARKLSRLSYSQMLELTSLGSKVLHPRSVALAQKHGVPLHVRGSFVEDEGTQIDTDEDASTFALTTSEHKVSLVTTRLLSQVTMEQEMRATLHHHRIPVLGALHTRLSATCRIPAGAHAAAVRALHDRFEEGGCHA